VSDCRITAAHFLATVLQRRVLRLAVGATKLDERYATSRIGWTRERLPLDIA
jgi:hypothetical protein